MKYRYLILLLLILGACNNNPEQQTFTSLQTSAPQGQELSTFWDTTTVIGEATLWRFSETEESVAWDSLQATNVFGFNEAPEIGTTAQIIPLTKKLPILYLKVTRTIPRDDFEEGSPQWHEVYFEDIRNQSYFNFEGPAHRRADVPIDLLVVYPPVKNAAFIKNDNIEFNDLPKDVGLDVIKGALDFDGDSKPDALVLEFCCCDPSSNENCDLTCGKTYIKYNGRWYLVDSSSPA